jgi:hypothetical protein
MVTNGKNEEWVTKFLAFVLDFCFFELRALNLLGKHSTNLSYAFSPGNCNLIKLGQ